MSPYTSRPPTMGSWDTFIDQYIYLYTIMCITPTSGSGRIRIHNLGIYVTGITWAVTNNHSTTRDLHNEMNSLHRCAHCINTAYHRPTCTAARVGFIQWYISSMYISVVYTDDAIKLIVCSSASFWCCHSGVFSTTHYLKHHHKYKKLW